MTEPVYQRFSHLGLRSNPFRVAERSDLAALYVPPPSPQKIALSDAGVAQIIGPRGRGKSTLLAAIEHALVAADVVSERHYIAADGPYRVPRPDAETERLLIDEAQRLSWWGWRRVRRWLGRAGRRLIVTTHADISRHVPESVVTVKLPEVDAGRLRELFQRRIEWAGGDPERIVLDDKAAEWLIRRCRANLRTIEMALYEVFQILDPADGTVVVGVPHLAACRERIEAFIAEAERTATRGHRAVDRQA